MIKGVISDDLEPIIEIILVFNGRKISQPAVVDTGFNGFLSVPHDLILESGWEFLGYEKYELADGKIIESRVYIGEVELDGKKRKVGVLSSHAKEILLGTRLLAGKFLQIDFKKKTLLIK
ncbi:hypothetical protein A2276_05410 [candidate division WOR-1 bacterium RIFOXYA12_FULL_43_27]|uniref:Clan AA aspartic protease n=1 Tax=candidate division WOR-1 bacterium RIFOXYC2_FULL_46_14 TaxID=1802587 RepID=A0A1F4U3Z6_UNCSA|nr:MAG: hypothetical protein A2276_05410 [candidate division WOR-1 bacterium RIFOXYA12_FULL_43_27]OGC20103.1 MAG: hypothetical protein A2292_03415 [candidate division WOR-1 bacterium RIFOXYB2_FULL_46_45]OGC32160.1 MAG: hypothetical protein A2232_08035 [candidate division WOR-1 bacterium RIFOXYA2_FULL_46_56]OGC39560.1 MAG: hypothetical protein A2438_08400 [candidate division WOR-1 bacterium RIFOXYC2_FULL_46_14]